MMSVVARWWWVGVLYYYSVFLLEIEFTLRCSLRNGHELCRAKKTEEKHVSFIFHCCQMKSFGVKIQNFYGPIQLKLLNKEGLERRLSFSQDEVPIFNDFGHSAHLLFRQEYFFSISSVLKRCSPLVFFWLMLVLV